MPRPARLLAVLLPALLIAAACSGDDDSTGETTPGPTVDTSNLTVENQPSPVQAPLGTPAQPEAGVFEIFVEGAAYHGNVINAALGQSIVIRVTNRDQTTHNLRIAGLDGQYDTEDDAVTEPPAIDGGASGQLDFAPAIRGAYTFRCDYHPGTMGGQIIVQ